MPVCSTDRTERRSSASVGSSKARATGPIAESDQEHSNIYAILAVNHNRLGERTCPSGISRHNLTSTFVIDMIRSVVVALLCVASSHVSAEQGRASHYGHGDGFHGRKTASGERFNAFAMTAAHRTRPMGSYVRVTNLANGRSVRVRINDRGPARRTGKIIDLSYGASRVIGMGGTARVSVQELAEESMADKANFTKEEWTLLLESPMIAGMAVTAADPSGLWGLRLQEAVRSLRRLQVPTQAP